MPPPSRSARSPRRRPCAFALIALPAGAIVDRRAKRWLMIWCDVARMLIIGSVPLAAAFGALTLGQLYAVAIAAGVCTVFFDVSYQSYLPALIGTDDLVDGNGKLGARSRSRRWPGRASAAAWSAWSARPGPCPRTRSPTRSRWPPCSPSAPARSRRIQISVSLSERDRRGAVVRPAPPDPAQDRGLYRDRESVRQHGRGAGVHLPDPAAARPARRDRPAHRRRQPGRRGRRGAVGRPNRRIGSARLIWFSMLVLSRRSCSSRWPSPAGGSRHSWSAWPGSGSAPWSTTWRRSLPPGHLPAAPAGPDEDRGALGRLGHAALGALLACPRNRIGVRTTLWIAFAGSWLAGWWVFFSPLRKMRDVPEEGLEEGLEVGLEEGLEVDRAPGSRVPGQGGGELPDSAGTALGD